MEPATQRKFTAAVFFVVLANTLDLLSTYMVSPNLADEWNVLQRVYGLGWPGLVAAKLLGGGLAILGYLYYLRHRLECYPPRGASFRAFCRAFAYGPPAHACADLVSDPPREAAVSQSETPAAVRVRAYCSTPSWMHLGVNLGYFWAGMQGLVVWVAVENILLTLGIAVPLRSWSELGYHMLQSAVVGGLVLLRFFAGNYRRYRLMDAWADVPDASRIRGDAPASAPAFDKPVRLC
ncbi:MAG: hypothetical protein ACP5VE_05055 [Chthonomonadales bacterium]